ncbi:hypothetical protein [Cloacibacterium sp.]|uniref:hypothetical protein n=1 Tax=Cloacibacterium sp. TaxID=1913682 RepID=UPI0039E512ED
MEKILILYGTEEFKGSLNRLKKEANNLNIFDKTIIYTPHDLPMHIKANPLMNYKKGGGYWIWKPYIIWKTLQDYPNSIVIYIDAGCSISKSEEWYQYFKLIEKHDTILFQYRNNFDYGWNKMWPSATTKIGNWTKLNTQKYFDQLIKDENWHSFDKIMGGIIICKNPKNEFISQWLNITLFKSELIVDPIGNEIGNQKEDFIEHRHDQSIITPLAYYYNDTNNIKILLETSESKIGTPAIQANRLKTLIEEPLFKKVIYITKRILYKLKKNLFNNKPNA